MATDETQRSKAFVDSSFVIALVNANDQLHSVAMALSQRLQTEKTRLVTTQAVLLEIGNALARRRFRSDAVRLLESVQRDPTIEIVPLSSSLFERTFALFRDRPDKEWGLVNCLSFIVMADHGIRDALTADEHFDQAGYVAVLRQT